MSVGSLGLVFCLQGLETGVNKRNQMVRRRMSWITIIISRISVSNWVLAIDVIVPFEIGGGCLAIYCFRHEDVTYTTKKDEPVTYLNN